MPLKQIEMNQYKLMSYRIVVQYKEQDDDKEIYSLWYLSKDEALREGTRNVKDLYGYQCVKKGLGRLLLEIKTKSTTISPQRYEVMRIDVKHA